MAGSAVTTSAVFVTLLEAPVPLGPGRMRIARATAENLPGDLHVRFPQSSAGDHEPHAKGDSILVILAYDDPAAAYSIASFCGGPAVQDGGNREIHARGGKSLRLVARAGESEILMDGGGAIAVTASDGDIRLESTQLIEIGADDKIIGDAQNGIDLVSNDGDIDVRQNGALPLPSQAVAMHPRIQAEILAMQAGIIAALTLISPVHVAAYNTAVGLAMALFVPPLVIGGKPATNLTAEPDP